MLAVEGLTAAIGGRVLFSGASFCCQPGRTVVVLGRNGAGKSTLLRLLAGIDRPSSGCVRWNGKPVHAMPSKARARIFAWQGEPASAAFGLTVRERILLARNDPGAAEEAASAMRLTPLLDRPLAALSAGERMRTELASVLVRDAPVWLLDEPTAHLDLDFARLWLSQMRNAARQGKLVIAVLHDLLQAQWIADDVLFVHEGGIAFGASEAMFTQQRLQALFGVPVSAVRVAGRRLWLPSWEAEASLARASGACGRGSPAAGETGSPV